MMANFLIGLREGLEASLVLGILIAYLVRTDRRSHLRGVWLGTGAAIAVSLAVGAAVTWGPRGLSFTAQEAIGGILSIVTVVLVTGMIFWMGKTARFLRSKLENALEAAANVGVGAIAMVALIAVGREGIETSLFLWAGISAAGSTTTPIVGAVLGLGTAVALGVLIYRGALRLDLRKFFQWTGVFLVLVAAGVLSYGIHDLQEAGILPGLHTLAFDVSAQVPAGSWYGTALKGIFNFSPQTSVLEAAAWLAYAVPTLYFFVRLAFGKAPARLAPATPATTTPQAAASTTK